jgi:hypothetical protein
MQVQSRSEPLEAAETRTEEAELTDLTPSALQEITGGRGGGAWYIHGPLMPMPQHGSCPGSNFV